ncbi:MAG: hypothetical protein ACREQ4_13190 [Candidatus Binataceae bacterium]
MAKDDQSSSLSPFQRFEKLAKALFAVPKKEIEPKVPRTRRKRRARKSTA